MGNAIELFRGLVGTEADMVTERQINEVLDACEKDSAWTLIMLYAYAGGGYQVRRMFVKTDRKDAKEFLWYLSPRTGLSANQPGKASIPGHEWDRDMIIMADPFFEWGYMMMDPFEHAHMHEWYSGPMLPKGRSE
ncbi:hypothetical protein FJY94_01490 [Candidatus Kaiserbacteria bacterium]|nr:hypothetical protein [Candidatus Kaiserbacteria bacterium]